jgi:predicted Fe-Mo cluster-binding NifX family protein
MRIVVTSSGADLDAPASPVFGRCPTFVLVDTETMAFEALENPAIAAAGGAGVRAAQFIVGKGVQAVVTGNVGPNAFQVLQSAAIPIYLFDGGTVRQAAEAHQAGKLPTAGSATAPEHAGMRGRRRVGRTGAAASSSAPSPSREAEITALKEMAGDLRGQLAQVLERLDRLEKGEQ